MTIKGLSLNSKFAKMGNVSTQPSTNKETAAKAIINPTTTSPLSKTVVMTTASKSVPSKPTINIAVKDASKPVVNINTKPKPVIVSTIEPQPIVVAPPPKITFQIPLIQKEKPIQYIDDVLNISETKIQNNTFVSVESNGISTLRPEVLSILDYKPIWKGFSPKKENRINDGITSTGKLIDFQYNLLWLRRDTLANLLYSIKNSNSENTINAFEHLLYEYNSEFDIINQTIKQYISFLKITENVKSYLNIRNIPRSSYSSQFLPMSDFFNSKMQIGPKEFEIFSNTKILMQLLFDFKSIAENYSYNLLDLSDTDRENDTNPVKIDKTYTLQDGFTFSISQLQSKSNPINALQRSFFNEFLNSLPTNPDDKIKLLTIILSKEYTVSKALGRNEVQKILQNTFSTVATGNPFDNIIGVVGDTIFDPPLGEQSLASIFFKRIDENSFVLPFERKYVDAGETKQTFIPGTGFFIDTILDTTGNNFNTKPFIDYVNQFSKKFINVKKIIESLFELTTETVITPQRMIDAIYGSYSRSIAGSTTTTNLNKDQTIIAAIFNLANKDNELKSLLFQYCLLLGIIQNTPDDVKPIFTQLANELGTISAFPNVNSSLVRNPSLRLGRVALNSFINELASRIENKIFSLTTSTPNSEMEITLQTNPEHNRFSPFNTNNSSNNVNIKTLNVGQTTINIERYNIRDLLIANAGQKTSSITNLILEFIKIANNFSLGASNNGEEIYLLNDGSGRTRFNFVSTSTQLLVLFEIFSSLASKYNFSTFNRSQTPFNTFITVDAVNNDFIKKTIDDIIRIPNANYNLSKLLEKFKNTKTYQSSQTFDAFSSPAQKSLQTSEITIKRSENSLNNISNTSNLGGTLSDLNSNQLTFINNNISSPFVGAGMLNKIGLIRVNQLDLELRTVKLKNSLNSIKNKIIEERKIKLNILDIFSTIEKNLRKGVSEIENNFTQQILQDFVENNMIDNLRLLKNPAQIRLSKFLLDEINEKKISNNSDQNVFISNLNAEQISSNIIINNNIVSKNSKELLYSLMSENLYLEPNIADLRTKIISIGIPNSFIKQLSDRIGQSSINEKSFNEKQFDVVSINIYKRDTKYEDIVLKPQSFIFDLSLFEETDLNLYQIEKNEKFHNILLDLEVKDYEEFNIDGTPMRKTIENIINDNKYNFLSNTQKQNIVKNHIVSSILKTYIKLLCEIDINEATFTEKNIEITNLTQSFQNLLFSYLREDLGKNIPNQSIEELLTNPDVDNESKDIIKLLTYGNVAFNPNYIKNIIMTPKIFDRVLNIPFNTEKFEIDINLTNQTQSGRNALSQLSTQEQIISIEDKLFLTPKNRDNIAFEDYFVTVETDF